MYVLVSLKLHLHVLVIDTFAKEEEFVTSSTPPFCEVEGNVHPWRGLGSGEEPQATDPAAGMVLNFGICLCPGEKCIDVWELSQLGTI